MAASSSDTAVPAPFSGFGPRAPGFFKALAFHQSKAWYDANRAIYEAEVKGPTVALLALLSQRFAAAGVPLRGDARSVFRLNRDVRFAREKHPYKTAGGAVLSRDGTRRTPGFVYLHIDPAGCFLAAGFWQPRRPSWSVCAVPCSAIRRRSPRSRPGSARRGSRCGARGRSSACRAASRRPGARRAAAAAPGLGGARGSLRRVRATRSR